MPQASQNWAINPLTSYIFLVVSQKLANLQRKYRIRTNKGRAYYSKVPFLALRLSIKKRMKHVFLHPLMFLYPGAFLYQTSTLTSSVRLLFGKTHHIVRPLEFPANISGSKFWALVKVS